MYPKIVQTWEFIRRYLSESDKLNWGKEPACRATMRKVLAAAEDCKIRTTLRSAEAWAALVVFMNMTDKMQEECIKKLKANNSATFSEAYIPTTKMCDDTSYDQEKKGYRSKGMRRSREAVRRLRSSNRPKESALYSDEVQELALFLDQRSSRHSNLGCYACGEFGHFKRECEVDPTTLHCKTCNKIGHMKGVCLTKANLYKSRSPSVAQARRLSSERAKMKAQEGQAKTEGKGPSQRPATPAPASRVIPPDGPTTALLAAQVPTQRPVFLTGKDQSFHATLPIKNDLKMLKLQTWPQKEDSPRRWITRGSTVRAVCDTGCTKTLVSEAFADSLGLRKRWFQEGKSPMVCLGNSEILALVLRNLPTEQLMSGDDLLNLGLLPPNWPNHGSEWTNPTEQPLREFPANKNMTEREVYINALLTISYGQGETDEPSAQTSTTPGWRSPTRSLTPTPTSHSSQASRKVSSQSA